LVNEVAVRRQNEQPCGFTIETPCYFQIPSGKRAIQQIEYKRRFPLIMGAGQANGLVHQKIDMSGRGLDGLLAEGHHFAVNAARRIPADFAVHADLALSDQDPRLPARGKPGTREICVKP